MEAALGGYNCSLFEGSSLSELRLQLGAKESEKKIRKQIWDYHDDQALRGIDNVFHLLDGEGSPKYPHDLVTLIRGTMQQEKQSCETGYFVCKWYKLGTMCIRFKRLDLLKKLDEIGGKAHGPIIDREK